MNYRKDYTIQSNIVTQAQKGGRKDTPLSVPEQFLSV